MSGDRDGAEKVFAEFLAFRTNAGDRLSALHTALWASLTGRKQEAAKQIEAVAGTADLPADVRSVAMSQSCLWSVERGAPDAARALAQKAVTVAASPAAKTLAGICAFLTQSKAPAQEWKTRAERAIANPAQASFRNQLAGFALTLDGQYAEAAPIWQQIYSETLPDAATESKVMWGLSLSKTGRQAEQAKLFSVGVIPPRLPEAGLGLFVYRTFRELENK
jgi:hypothetical protein